MHGNLAGLSFKNFSDYADDISYIIGLEPLIIFFTDVVALNVALDAAFFILKINKCGLTHDTLGHDTTCNGNFASIHGIKIIFDALAVRVYIPCFVKKRIPARISKVLKFFSSDLSLLRELFLCLLYRNFLLFRHISVFIGFHNLFLYITLPAYISMPASNES